MWNSPQYYHGKEHGYVIIEARRSKHYTTHHHHQMRIGCTRLDHISNPENKPKIIPVSDESMIDRQCIQEMSKITLPDLCPLTAEHPGQRQRNNKAKSYSKLPRLVL